MQGFGLLNLYHKSLLSNIICFCGLNIRPKTQGLQKTMNILPAPRSTSFSQLAELIQDLNGGFCFVPLVPFQFSASITGFV